MFNILKELLFFVQPIFIVWLIDFFNGKIDLKTALIYCLLISGSLLLSNFANHYNFLGLQYEGMKLRISLIGLIYKKVYNITSFLLLKEI